VNVYQFCGVARSPRLISVVRRVDKMEILRQFTSAIFLIFLFAGYSLAAEPGIVEASSQKCTHGLHPQPNNGPFSVFLFCDDALGSNIGIILTERGAGPGNVPLNDQKVWQTWDTVNRFWQDRKWAADVINFVWSPSQRYLYVATSGIYGDGGFFKIDLREHTYQQLMPSPNAPYKFQLKDMYYTRIRTIDLKNKKIVVEISLWDRKEERVATEVFPFE
jgi:hypothetical protein